MKRNKCTVWVICLIFVSLRQFLYFFVHFKTIHHYSNVWSQHLFFIFFIVCINVIIFGITYNQGESLLVSLIVFSFNELCIIKCFPWLCLFLLWHDILSVLFVNLSLGYIMSATSYSGGEGPEQSWHHCPSFAGWDFGQRDTHHMSRTNTSRSHWLVRAHTHTHTH